MKVNRQSPVNIIEEDSILFSHEMMKEINAPSIFVIRLFLADLYQFHCFGSKKINQNGLHYLKYSLGNLFTNRLSIYKSGAIIVDHWSCNYFHWFTEVIPKILFFQKQNKEFTLFLPYWVEQFPFIAASLKYLEPLKIKFVGGKRNHLFIKAFGCNLNVSSGNYLPSIIQEVRDCFKEQAQENIKIPGIFIYRKPEQKRAVINFNELETVLNKYEILVVNFELLTWNQQREIAASANILVGVHGAGMTNMLFMDKKSVVFELRKKGDASNNCYFSLASACDHKYFYQQCDVTNENEITQNNNFIVDVELFEDNLRKALASVQ